MSLNPFMQAALQEASLALDEGEIPIGAVVVRAGEILVRSHNLRERLKDPTAHAEILAMRAASEILGSWRLNECDVYVTLEPCAMCAGAMVLARIKTLYFGATDTKAGAVVSLYRLLADERLNHRVPVFGGIMEESCEEILKRFFSGKRCNPG